jgi:hypothetical protein
MSSAHISLIHEVSTGLLKIHISYLLKSWPLLDLPLYFVLRISEVEVYVYGCHVKLLRAHAGHGLYYSASTTSVAICSVGTFSVSAMC